MVELTDPVTKKAKKAILDPRHVSRFYITKKGKGALPEISAPAVVPEIPAPKEVRPPAEVYRPLKEVKVSRPAKLTAKQEQEWDNIEALVDEANIALGEMNLEAAAQAAGKAMQQASDSASKARLMALMKTMSQEDADKYTLLAQKVDELGRTLMSITAGARPEGDLAPDRLQPGLEARLAEAPKVLRLKKFIGSGGFGTVFLADVDIPGVGVQEKAVKFMNPKAFANVQGGITREWLVVNMFINDVSDVQTDGEVRPSLYSLAREIGLPVPESWGLVRAEGANYAYMTDFVKGKPADDLTPEEALSAVEKTALKNIDDVVEMLYRGIESGPNAGRYGIYDIANNLLIDPETGKVTLIDPGVLERLEPWQEAYEEASREAAAAEARGDTAKAEEIRQKMREIAKESEVREDHPAFRSTLENRMYGATVLKNILAEKLRLAVPSTVPETVMAAIEEAPAEAVPEALTFGEAVRKHFPAAPVSFFGLDVPFRFGAAVMEWAIGKLKAAPKEKAVPESETAKVVQQIFDAKKASPGESIYDLLVGGGKPGEKDEALVEETKKAAGRFYKDVYVPTNNDWIITSSFIPGEEKTTRLYITLESAAIGPKAIETILTEFEKAGIQPGYSKFAWDSQAYERLGNTIIEVKDVDYAKAVQIITRIANDPDTAYWFRDAPMPLLKPVTRGVAASQIDHYTLAAILENAFSEYKQAGKPPNKLYEFVKKEFAREVSQEEAEGGFPRPALNPERPWEDPTQGWPSEEIEEGPWVIMPKTRAEFAREEIVVTPAKAAPEKVQSIISEFKKEGIDVDEGIAVRIAEQLDDYVQRRTSAGQILRDVEYTLTRITGIPAQKQESAKSVIARLLYDVDTDKIITDFKKYNVKIGKAEADYIKQICDDFKNQIITEEEAIDSIGDIIETALKIEADKTVYKRQLIELTIKDARTIALFLSFSGKDAHETARNIKTEIERGLNRVPVTLESLKSWEIVLNEAKEALKAIKDKITPEERAEAELAISNLETRFNHELNTDIEYLDEKRKELSERGKNLPLNVAALSEGEEIYNQLQALNYIARRLPAEAKFKQGEAIRKISSEVLDKLGTIANLDEKKRFIDEIIQRANEVPVFRAFLNYMHYPDEVLRNKFDLPAGPLSAYSFLYYEKKWVSFKKSKESYLESFLKYAKEWPEFAKLTLSKLTKSIDSLIEMQNEFRARMSQDSKKTLEDVTKNELVRALFKRATERATAENKLIINKRADAKLLENKASGAYHPDVKTLFLGYEFKELRGNLDDIILHELAHYVWDVQLTEAQRNEWLKYVKNKYPEYLYLIKNTGNYYANSEIELANEALAYMMGGFVYDKIGRNYFGIQTDREDILKIKELGLLTSEEADTLISRLEPAPTPLERAHIRLRSVEPDEQIAGIEILASIGGQEAIGIIKDGLHYNIPRVRIAAINALAKLGEYEPIKEMLNDENGRVRNAAAEALAKMPQEAAPAIEAPAEVAKPAEVKVPAAMPEAETPVAGRAAGSIEARENSPLWSSGMGVAVVALVLVILAALVMRYYGARKPRREGDEQIEELERILERLRKNR
ncbi:MAG: HEAT repeat domain-containing protein [Candidatus Woesearchaeota archaeon]